MPHLPDNLRVHQSEEMFTFYGSLPYRGGGGGAFHFYFACTYLPLLSAYTLCESGLFRAHVGWISPGSACSQPNSDPWEMPGLSPAPGHSPDPFKAPQPPTPLSLQPWAAPTSPTAQAAGVVGRTLPKLPGASQQQQEGERAAGACGYCRIEARPN